MGNFIGDTRYSNIQPSLRARVVSSVSLAYGINKDYHRIIRSAKETDYWLAASNWFYRSIFFAVFIFDLDPGDRRKIFHPVVTFCSPLDWLQEEWGGNWLSIDLSSFFFFSFSTCSIRYLAFLISLSLSPPLSTRNSVHPWRSSVELNRNYEHTNCFELWRFDLKIKYLRQIGNYLRDWYEGYDTVCNEDKTGNNFIR